MIIRTVLGDILPQDLGLTASHEHLLWAVPELEHDNDPDLGLDSVPAAVAEVRRFKRAGGHALIEMSTPEIGRCPFELAQISHASEVHIIAATGHHKAKYSAAALAGLSAADIAARMIAEINFGMVDYSVQRKTDIRAGVIKIATSLNTAHESELRVIQAAGIAHQQTGAPVSTHTEKGTYAIEQANLLMAAGVKPEKICIGHLDYEISLDTYLRIADLGVYLGIDQVGQLKYRSDEQRACRVQALIERGYAKQILLSGDTARKTAWRVHNPNANGIAHLLTHFIPILQTAGVCLNHIHTLLIDNPPAFLAFSPSGAN